MSEKRLARYAAKQVKHRYLSPPTTFYLLRSTKKDVPTETYWGITSDLRKKTLHINRKLLRPSLPIPKATFRDLHWQPLLAVTGLNTAQLPALLYKVNAGVKAIPPSLLRSGQQRDPLLHRVASICKALQEPHTWDPTLHFQTAAADDASAPAPETMQDVVCHWHDEAAQSIPQKLNLAWGANVLHRPLTWEGLMAANGRAPKTAPLNDKQRTLLRSQVGRRKANSIEHWRNMRRLLQARKEKEATLLF